MSCKPSLVILGCLMLFSSFAAVPIVMVRAPVSEPIIMWAVVCTDPYWGEYGGYWDVMYAIRDELIKIGIDMRIVTQDSATWWDTVWESKWNVTGDADGHPETYTYGVDGWDISVNGRWLSPTSYIWLDEIVGSWNLPPNGYNIMSWLDTKADEYYKKAQTTLDPAEHKKYMWLWQEEFMHNPPAIPMFYLDLTKARAAYLDGYDDTAWLYELSQIDVNEANFWDPATQVPDTRKAIGSDTLIYGAKHPIWSFFPVYTLSRTEEAMNVLKQGMLYRTSREDLTFPPSGKYIVKPSLAADFPTWGQLDDGRYYANITLKQGVTWTDNVPFNASDFAFSVNSVLNRAVKSYGYRTYYLWDHADVLEPYKVRIVYKPGLGPDYDLAGYMAHGWAWSMLPWHQLKDTDPIGWKVSTFATDPIPDSSDGPGGDHLGLECLGPYVPVEWVGVPPNYVKFQKRTEYVNALGWATTIPDNFIVKITRTPAEDLYYLRVDFIDPTIPYISPPISYVPPYLKEYTSSYPASHPLWMNLRNPILSNRYVRLAIAHAIPYPKIFKILSSWGGVATTYQGKTFVTPWHESFNTELAHYEYNIAKAQAYMDVWRYSQAGMTEYTKGPVGDHDLSGYVEIADFPIWAKWFGTSPTKDTLYPYPDKWPSTPGNDVDADNDNNAYVEMPDFTLWAANFGKRYPYPRAW